MTRIQIHYKFFLHSFSEHVMLAGCQKAWTHQLFVKYKFASSLNKRLTYHRDEGTAIFFSKEWGKLTFANVEAVNFSLKLFLIDIKNAHIMSKTACLTTAPEKSLWDLQTSCKQNAIELRTPIPTTEQKKCLLISYQFALSAVKLFLGCEQKRLQI